MSPASARNFSTPPAFLIIRLISPDVFCHTFNLRSADMAGISSPCFWTRLCSHVFSDVEVCRLTGAEVAARASSAVRQRRVGMARVHRDRGGMRLRRQQSGMLITLMVVERLLRQRLITARMSWEPRAARSA